MQVLRDSSMAQRSCWLPVLARMQTSSSTLRSLAWHQRYARSSCPGGCRCSGQYDQCMFTGWGLRTGLH